VSNGSPTLGTVLVCDDEEINRALLERLLQGFGYDVVPVSSGAEALSALRRLQPDLVLLDVQMPGMNGFEVCAQLKQAAETRLIPVALVTGLNSRDHKIRGLQAGADDFIGKPFDPEELQARVASLVRLKQYTDDLDSTEGILRSLALIIEARDQYTDGHCERLSHYAVALGAALGRHAEDLSALDRGGYLHDIGKIGIPDALLLKPSALTPEEFELMKQHTVIGDRLCGELRSLRLVREIVRQHHERLDGSGYPDGLRGDQVSVLAQIVSTVDLYDAVTSARPYRPALPPEYAFAELRDEAARGLRNPQLVEAFIDLARSGDLGRPTAAAGDSGAPGSPAS
jgi:putative two-component system response regulator